MRQNSSKLKLLIVDDDHLVLQACESFLKKKYDVTATISATQALDLLNHQEFPILLTDLMMDEMHGIELVKRAKKVRPDLICVVMTGFASIETAISSLKAGVFDFVEKPFNKALVEHALDRVSEFIRIREEARKYQERWIETRRMNAITRLSRGISHELGNVLASMVGNAELLLLKAESDKIESDELIMKLENIIERGIKGSEFIQQLQGFAGQGDYHVRAQYLLELLETTTRTFAKTFPDLRFNLHAPQDIRVMGDPMQISQCMQNVILNSVDASSDSGTIEISLTQVDITSPEDLLTGELPAGKYAKIQVQDFGLGIPEDELKVVFEPFFSKDKNSQSRGLGLATVFGVVKNHNGWIDLKSKVGEGTTFSVYLPAMLTQATDSQAKESKMADTPAMKKILIIDDEEHVLEMCTDLVDEFGYETRSFLTGAEGIKAFKADQFALVITDIFMKPVDGLEVFRAVRKVDPNVPVIITTGYTDSEKVQEVLSHYSTGFLSKPFRVNQLYELLKKLLPISAS